MRETTIFAEPNYNYGILLACLFCFLPVQERLTREIAEAIMAAISPSGVGVVIEAT